MVELVFIVETAMVLMMCVMLIKLQKALKAEEAKSKALSKERDVFRNNWMSLAGTVSVVTKALNGVKEKE